MYEDNTMERNIGREIRRDCVGLDTSRETSFLQSESKKKALNEGVSKPLFVLKKGRWMTTGSFWIVRLYGR